MPKKKKRKTKKEKQQKEKRRETYIESVDNMQSTVSESDEKADIETKKDARVKTVLSESDIKSQNDKFIVSNIKRALVYAFIFLLIIVILYVLELKYHYFSDWASRLMTLFIK